MHILLHPSHDRGYANHGWLKSHHSFSFAGYYDPAKMNFGALRVLNDDRIAGGTGFSAHPHDNMEIISIPLVGGLRHKDSLGGEFVIEAGEVQVMSAGTGIVHSEMNANNDREAKFLQIWIMPNQRNVAPRYQQKQLPNPFPKNQWVNIIRPAPSEGLWIHQNSWLSIGELEQDKELVYLLNDPKNGIYMFVITGGISCFEHELSEGDAIGISDVTEVAITVKYDARVLIIEVPLR
jgi:quercetin 2,3-dioxygenase